MLLRGGLAVATALALAAGIAGCSATSGNVRLAQTEASGDGVLRIGLLLDNAGGQAFLNYALSTQAQDVLSRYGFARVNTPASGTP